VVAVPSGNFGNLTAGLIAARMGLPVHAFLAATNDNKVVPEYLQSGFFRSRPSVSTVSNAMDVGNPSNFMRMTDLYSDIEQMREHIKGYYYSDIQTVKAIGEIKQKYNYTIDPHGAVGYLALKDYLKDAREPINGIFLETAHPVKFPDVVEQETGETLEIPERLKVLLDLPKLSLPLSADFQHFKAFLLEQYVGVRELES